MAGDNYFGDAMDKLEEFVSRYSHPSELKDRVLEVLKEDDSLPPQYQAKIAEASQRVMVDLAVRATRHELALGDDVSPHYVLDSLVELARYLDEENGVTFGRDERSSEDRIAHLCKAVTPVIALIILRSQHE